VGLGEALEALEAPAKTTARFVVELIIRCAALRRLGVCDGHLEHRLILQLRVVDSRCPRH
jgi:hypothetical protein